MLRSTQAKAKTREKFPWSRCLPDQFWQSRNMRQPTAIWSSAGDGLTNRAGRTNRSTSCIYVQRRKMSVKRATKRHSIGLVEIVFTPSKKKSSCLIMISSELTGSNFGLSWTQFCVHIRMFKLRNGIPEQDSRTFKKAPPRYKIALANPKTSNRSGSRTVVWIFTAV